MRFVCKQILMTIIVFIRIINVINVKITLMKTSHITSHAMRLSDNRITLLVIGTIALHGNHLSELFLIHIMTLTRLNSLQLLDYRCFFYDV